MEKCLKCFLKYKVNLILCHSLLLYPLNLVKCFSNQLRKKSYSSQCVSYRNQCFFFKRKNKKEISYAVNLYPCLLGKLNVILVGNKSERVILLPIHLKHNLQILLFSRITWEAFSKTQISQPFLIFTK